MIDTAQVTNTCKGPLSTNGTKNNAKENAI